MNSFQGHPVILDRTRKIYPIVYIPARAGITAIHKSHVPVRMHLWRNIKNGSQVRCLIELTRRSRIEAPRVDYEKLSGDRLGESSESIRK